jgi:HK97 family phage major capsid protein
LTIKKLASIPKVTNELLADANVQVISYLSELIAEQFAKAEDDQLFNGSGSPFVGCLQATGVPSRAQAGGTAAVSLSYQDLINATGDIYTNALSNAKFYFNRTMGAHIRGLITTAGAPIFSNTAQEIAGFPIVLAEMLPIKTNAAAASTAYAIFGDLRKGVAIGERGSITMKISDQATVNSDNLFEKDMVALRAIERFTLGVVLPSSFLKITTGA